jgi:GcrA cell cycle regulator
MFEPTWTAERVELLKNGFEAGLSCRQIAADIGVTRNAVIGKISRLNLSRAEGGGGFSERPRERRSGPRIQREKRVTQRQVLMALDAQPAQEEAPLCSEQRCSLLELSEEKCRWPISNLGGADFWFCGNKPVERLPYCAGHARIAYNSSRQRGAR